MPKVTGQAVPVPRASPSWPFLLKSLILETSSPWYVCSCTRFFSGASLSCMALLLQTWNCLVLSWTQTKQSTSAGKMQTTSNASVEYLASPPMWAGRKQTGSGSANHRERNTPVWNAKEQGAIRHWAWPRSHHGGRWAGERWALLSSRLLRTAWVVVYAVKNQ